MNLDQTLTGLSDADKRLVYLSALPLWLDPDVLITLHNSREAAAHVLEILERLLLLTRVSENRAVIRPEARRKLFRAAHDGQLADFVEAHKRLAHYFIDRVEKTQDHADQFSWARAATYHLLAAGEPTGWEWLAHLYDDAQARGLISATQQLLQPLQELRFLLSLEDHAALTVYRARTATLTGNYRNAERLLRAVCALSKSQTLLAVTHRTLGQTLMAQQRWAQALQQLKKSRAILEHSGNAFSLALTWASIGDLYQEMADFSGGIEPPEPEPPYKPWARRLRAIIYIPGRFYSQLSQRIQRLPFINVDLGYQNWVVTRLMLAAVAAYRQAEKALPDDPSPQALYDVRIGLARMYTRLGRIRRAERLLEELEKWDYVRESEYRQAFVFYWRAEVARFQHQNGTAVLLLKEAGRIFSKFQQLRGLAAIHKHLGTLAIQTGERQTALDELRRSADFYKQAGQPLFHTAVLNQITELTGDESATENGRHEYLSRFPNRLAGVYRLLAFLVLTFLLLISIGLAFVALIFTVIAEDNITLQLPGTFIFGLISLTWPLIAIWIFQIVNLMLGLIVSQILPIGQLGRDPPLRIVIDPARLTLAEGTVLHSASRTDMLWEDIAGVQEVNYQLWSRPVELISYLDPLSGGKRYRIPADTIGFQALHRDLHRRLPDSAWISSTYTLFTPRISLLTACLIIIGAIFFQVVFEFNFPIFGALSGAFICTILFFPLGAFWRLTIFLIRMRRITPTGYPPPPRHLGEVLTYFGTLVWTLLNLAFIWVLIATFISRL